MQVLWVLRVLRRRKLVLVLGAILAAVVAIAAHYKLSTSSPFVSEKGTASAEASAQLLIDFRVSALTNATRTPDVLASRAAVYAQLASSDEVRSVAAKYAGVPNGSFGSGTQLLSAKQSAAGIGGTGLPGGTQPLVVFTAEGGAPLIDVNAQAADVGTALRLVNGSSRALRDFIVGLGSSQRTPSDEQIRLRQLGPATGHVVSSTASKRTVILDGVAIWVAIVLLVLFVAFLREQAKLERAQGGSEPESEVEPYANGEPAELDPDPAVESGDIPGVKPAA